MKGGPLQTVEGKVFVSGHVSGTVTGPDAAIFSHDSCGTGRCSGLKIGINDRVVSPQTNSSFVFAGFLGSSRSPEAS